MMDARLKGLSVALVLVALSGACSLAYGEALEIEFQNDYQLVSESLTTDQFGVIDPNQENPHLQQWALTRKLEWMGLRVLPQKGERYGVELKGIQSKIEGYVRPAGPWYLSFSEFSCERIPNSLKDNPDNKIMSALFSTQEGAKKAVQRAGEEWVDQVSHSKVKLELLLKRISEPSKGGAFSQANRILNEWQRTLERDWRRVGLKKVRQDEWKFYLASAQRLGFCKKEDQRSRKETNQASLLKARMEPITGEGEKSPKVLARAPARLWDGMFSVRLMIKMAGKTLNGRFLIDPALPKSTVSPSWVESQGVLPDRVLISGAPSERVSAGIFRQFRDLSGRKTGGALARPVEVQKVEMGGLEFPLEEFLLIDSDFFRPPETVGTCCDGVLGRDFLRHYPFEFSASQPREVMVWPRENFVLPAVNSSRAHSLSHSQAQLSWLAVLEAPDELKVELQGFLPEYASKWETLSQWPLESGLPIATHGKFALDLPHGRLWFSNELIEKGPPSRNTSGLALQFIRQGADRILRVKALDPKSPAKPLVQAGLTVGKTITRIDGTDSDELDQWEVDRRLSGESGDTVVLEWQTEDGLKLAPFQVKN